MNRIILFVIGAVCGTGITSTVYQNHIVQTNDKWLFVPRSGVSLNDMYADVRKWGPEEWRAHIQLSKDLLKAGHAEVMKPDLTEAEPEHAVERLSQRTDTHRSAVHQTQEHDTPTHTNTRRTDLRRSERRHTDFDAESAPE